MTNWRPTPQEIAQAIEQLAGKRGGWVQRRLSVLNSLMNQGGQIPLSDVAKDAETRTATVKRLLDHWQNGGIEAIVSFGRPLELDPALLKKLGSEVVCGHIKSRAELGSWIQKEFGHRFSDASIRAYCNRLKINLPAQLKPTAQLPAPARKLIWTNRQVASLKAADPKLGLRAQMVLEAGTTGKSINKVADGHEISRSALQRDVRAFKEACAYFEDSAYIES